MTQKSESVSLTVEVKNKKNGKERRSRSRSRSRSRTRYRGGPGTGNAYRKLRRRAVFKNGEYNVIQTHVSKRRRKYLQDLFTTLVDIKWRWTILVFALSFLMSWFSFACLWWLIAYTHGDLEPENLKPDSGWTPCVDNINGFTSCFLFSLETQHTIGYGGRATTEECPEAVLTMCMQSIWGMMIQAFMVGIIFAKMARPKQRTQTLLFSRNAVVCQRDGQLCLMFRVGDMRERSHLIAASVRAQIIRPRATKEGEYLSPFLCELDVQVDDYNSNIFLIWPKVVVHKIDASSPLYHLSAADIIHDRFEIVVILEGTTESTGQTTQARSSYLPHEILWGHRFEPIVSYSKEKLSYIVDYSLFHNTYQVDTPLCSAQELQTFMEQTAAVLEDYA
ncbi:ATP-sensitive inward rectifier potassium channel 12-like isoform X3 [Macrosteles quadrilineatus]|uniref:ATP-sensitive inward rectifier potassium channel 12-like isoform X2 n=1 Tax=Macrosteles quadrilineatus TaxID=74068 RepID=UPI0023E27054|nr:ATP-sensitive inward rectifier potassium channel 12-like isoform X2 [Macrosteles quadrilineatus]XP_054285042.1 ATP-sensitive inward rectifier potassium channel 12-like isoform X3 [Macrosteles quadrilineatus]